MSYPPEGKVLAWEFPFRIDRIKQYKDSAGYYGIYEGEGHFKIQVDMNYIVGDSKPIFPTMDTLIGRCFATDPGVGGYNRTGVSMSLVPIDANLVNSAVVHIHVWVKINIRSMESPTTTDFSWQLSTNYLSDWLEERCKSHDSCKPGGIGFQSTQCPVEHRTYPSR